MTRRLFWLGLLLVASQLSSGCCCWREHCAGWRIRALASRCHGGQCGSGYGGPVAGPMYGAGPGAGPACGSCYTPPGDFGHHPPAVVPYGGPMIPGGPTPGGPPIAGPYPLTPVPSGDPGTGFPQPMPPR